MNWLDLGVIVFIVIFIIIGVKHGLMTSVLSNFSLSVNCLISFFLYKPFAFIYNKLFHIGNIIYNNYYSSLIEKGTNLSVDLLSIPTENVKDTVSLAINESGLSIVPKTMFKIFLKNKKDLTIVLANNHTTRTTAEIISQTFSTFFVTIIAFVTSVILLYLIVWLFKLLATKLRTIGFVKIVDNIFGSFYGIFKCFITLIIICFIIELLSTFSFMIKFSIIPHSLSFNSAVSAIFL